MYGSAFVAGSCVGFWRYLSFCCCCCLSVCFLTFVFERARAGERAERERIPSRICTVSAEPDMGPEPMNREIMTRAEADPGAPDRTCLSQEGGREKSFRYWPRLGSRHNTVTYGRFKITTRFRTDSGCYATTGLKMKHLLTGQERTVWHLQYTDWPEHGCPEDLKGFLCKCLHSQHSLCLLLNFFVFLHLFIFERHSETEHKQGRGRETRSHRIRSRLQALSCQHRAQRGA